MTASHSDRSPVLLDARATAACLPWTALADAIEALLRDGTAQVPARTVLPLAGGASLFAMPAADDKVAITKLITYTPGNTGTGRPAIQGDVVVFDVATGERRLILHGPTVTARRTAAVSLVAARHLAPAPSGPLLVIGAGVQGLAHAQAFAEGLGIRDVWVASRTPASADALVQQLAAAGLAARTVTDMAAAAAVCPWIVTCTPADAHVLHTLPPAASFIAAVGAFTPRMAELAPAVCTQVAEAGQIVVDTADAVHEAGDLLQAGIDVAALPTLADAVAGRVPRREGPVLFKSCGWGGWDLAAARLAMQTASNA